MAPLPPWRVLADAVRHPADRARLLTTWCGAGDQAWALSRSAWSLAVIAAARRAHGDGSVPCVWVPSYFCDSSLEPLRNAGVRLAFYPVAADLTPDLAAAEALALEQPPDIFVLVHYFGAANDAVAAERFCVPRRAWLVEDAAHVLRPVAGIGERGDFVLYSPHKHLAIPDGAVLVARAKGPSLKGEPDRVLAALTVAHQAVLAAAPSNRVSAAVWLVKRVLQKLGIRARVGGWSASNFTEDPGPAPIPPPRMSGIAERLLAAQLPALDAVARARALNRDVWGVLLAGLAAQAGSRHPMGTAKPVDSPYVAEFRFDEAGAARTFFHEASKLGVPVTTWPDLPAEVGTSDQPSEARRRRAHSCFVVVHQGLSVGQMATSVTPASSEPASGLPALNVQWDSVSRADWNAWIRRAGRSNVLQSWAYGEAKTHAGGWRVRRAVIRRGETPVAIAQVLRKSYFGFLQVSRISRGPLFLEPVSPGETYAVLKELGKTAALWRGSVFTLSPEVESSAAAVVQLWAAGFRRLARPAWSSAWLSLTPELPEIRARLDRKWRNMLTAAEKQGMVLREGSEAELWALMLERHAAHMDHRQFEGISIELLEALHGHRDSEGDLSVLIAEKDGEAVAGICIATHGAAATYMVGWSTNAGRDARATHFLLWQAIASLKRAGCLWFDLGGIDETRTPGVARFKSGLNGQRYTLVGEYVSG